MKRIMRLFAIVGLMSVLLPSSTLAEVVQYKGARVGFSSERDVVFDIPLEMSPEDVLHLMRNFYKNHLQSVETERIFTIAERRLLLLCIFTEMCNAETFRQDFIFCSLPHKNYTAFWRDVWGKSYEEVMKEIKQLRCDFDFSDQTGYLVDRDKFNRIRDAFGMPLYIKTTAHRCYVEGMYAALYDDFQRANPGAPTEFDVVVNFYVAMQTRKNGASKFLGLESGRGEDEAVLWNSQNTYILESDRFRMVWSGMRHFGREVLLYMEDYIKTLKVQCDLAYEEVETERIMHMLVESWEPFVRTMMEQFSRTVYDVPYVLLITKASQIVYQSIPFPSFFRTETDRQNTRLLILTVSKQMGDSADVLENLSSTIATAQTSRLIELLKKKLGASSYEGFAEQSKLLKQFETYLRERGVK